MTVIPVLREILIAGSVFRSKDEQAVLRGAAKGCAVTFAPEPDNAHDKFAVQVRINGAHVGYVPRVASAALYALREVYPLDKIVGVFHGEGKVSMGVQRG